MAWKKALLVAQRRDRHRGEGNHDVGERAFVLIH
jgi:hypothetical protein